MRLPSPSLLKYLRKEYPSGTRIELINMDDPQAPPSGTQGKVIAVDDMAQILVSWDTGSSLSVIYGKDSIKKI